MSNHPGRLLIYAVVVVALGYGLYCLYARETPHPQTKAERCAQIRHDAFDAPIQDSEGFNAYMKKMGCDQPR